MHILTGGYISYMSTVQHNILAEVTAHFWADVHIVFLFFLSTSVYFFLCLEKKRCTFFRALHFLLRVLQDEII